jgi:hypothetical protein
MRWLLKPPEPLAMQIHEPKLNVVPSLSTALVKLNVAIEFARGSSMNAPTGHASSRYFTAKPT